MRSKSDHETQKINCLIVDDEPLALDLIEDFIKRIPFLSLTGRCNSAYEAIEILSRQKINLLFLDIQMPHLNGIDLIKSIENKPFIILTTAYSKYAVEAFDLAVIDYLVKPIEFNRFLRAANKVYSLVFSKKTEKKSFKSESLTSSPSPEYFLIKKDYTTVNVSIESILYIEGLKDYIKIYNGGKALITKCTMHNAEIRLPVDKFLRVHKSFIVSLSKIKAIENNHILIADKRIPIGDYYKSNFLDMVKKYML